LKEYDDNTILGADFTDYQQWLGWKKEYKDNKNIIMDHGVK
jgi:hypothetical protein